jgi:class 3 adenylate cyclase
LLSVDEQLLDAVTGAFYHLLRGQVPGPVPIPEGLPDNEVRQLLVYVNRFLSEYAPLTRALESLGEGDLDIRPPPGRMAAVLSYKALQSNLRHLTWKTQRIASGRLDERVDFLGELSTAFNSMSRQLSDSFEVIRREKEQSERLLRNILPASVAEELKEQGSSEPQLFDQVSVLFSDVVGFTQLAADMPPQALIAELNELFTRFDVIMEAHGCERIKTIGDAYLAVCGMPQPNPDHARTLVAAAVAMLDQVRELQRRRSGWQIRIGIHSGHLVGGIVGVKKYIYDVFGDAVNTASRMETHSAPMRINLSEASWRLVRDVFPCSPREPIQVKGKGPMHMYFVD